MSLSLAERIDLTEKRITSLTGRPRNCAKVHIAELQRLLATLHDEAAASGVIAAKQTIEAHP